MAFRIAATMRPRLVRFVFPRSASGMRILRFRGRGFLFLYLSLLLAGLPPAPAMATTLTVSRIDIDGLTRTSQRVVRRELPFHEGSVWKPDYKATGERLLRNLGLFSEARITPPDDEGIVRVFVRERWTLWPLPEVSRSDVGKTTAGLSLTDYNLWGLHHKLRLGFREDTGKNFTDLNGTTYLASYLWRRIADSKLSLEGNYNSGRSVFDTFNNGVLGSQYRLKTSSWSVRAVYGLGPVPGEGWDLGLGFASSLSSFILVSGPPLATVHDSRRKGLQATASYRRIDDQITRLTGVNFGYSLDVAHRAFGSTINVYRQQAALSAHLPFSSRFSHTTVDVRLNGGGASGNVFEDGLFDIGSGKQVRGYLPGELQGTYYIFGTLEGRIPVSSGGNFQVVPFADVGQIWERGNPAFGKDIIVGSGVGVRWILRWLIRGTFRADVAYAWARRRWRIHLGTGQAF